MHAWLLDISLHVRYQLATQQVIAA